MMNFRVMNTFSVSVVGILLLTSVHFVFEKEMLELAKDESMQALVRNAWYLFFALTNALLIVIVTLYAKAKKLEFDIASKLLMYSFVALSLMQIARYLDRLVLESNVLGNLYSISIPSINITVTLLIFFYAFGSIVMSNLNWDG